VVVHINEYLRECMVGRKQKNQLAPRRSFGLEKTSVVTDDIPEKPQLSVRELSVVECYLGKFLAELLQQEAPVDKAK
jgi:hypothetical protein